MLILRLILLVGKIDVGVLKMNINGVHSSTNGASACGRIIRERDGCFIV
jgi:hypothetical protein